MQLLRPYEIDAINVIDAINAGIDAIAIAAVDTATVAAVVIGTVDIVGAKQVLLLIEAAQFFNVLS